MGITIGYSGLDNSVEYKRSRFSTLSPREYAFVQGVDAAACLAVNGELACAAAEERFTGEKHTGRFPVNAIQYCLDANGLTLSDVDQIAHCFNYSEASSIQEIDEYQASRYETVLSPSAQRGIVAKHLGQAAADRLVCVPHHLAHAASAYFSCDLDDPLIYVADGMGEVESATVGVAEAGEIRLLERTSSMHSLGVLYGIFTHYLGFLFNSDEYKVMGLAPYGNPARYRSAFQNKVIRKLEKGRYSIPPLSRNRTAISRETYSGTLDFLANEFGPARSPGESVSQHHMDIAAALQEALNEAILHQLSYHANLLSKDELCFAGGVALNCTTNAVIASSGLFKRIHIFPAAGDDGAAAGAALYVENTKARIKRQAATLPYWGPSVSGDRADEIARQRKGLSTRRFANEEDLITEVVTALERGEIIGWAQGRMEFGPRALGNRSILADPRRAAMKDNINRRVKQREAFRPFAPAVTREAARRFFNLVLEDDTAYSWMIITAQANLELAAQIPAVIHVDNSARVQCVDKAQSPRFWKLINAFGDLTGVPVLLNTSFNVNKQPIVRTEADAISTFEVANLDAVVIDDVLIRRAV